MNKRNDKHHKIFLETVLCFLGILLIFVLAILIAQIAGDLLDILGVSEARSSFISQIVSGVIASIAAGLVILQLRDSANERARQNNLEEASFLLQYNQTFIQDPNMTEVEHLLEEQAFYNYFKDIISTDNRQKFVNYLVYLEGLSPLVLHGVLPIEYIDDLMAYRFFIAVNNRELQDKELKKFPDDYRGIFKLYKEWSKYRKERGYLIHLEESALDRWEDFSYYAK